MSQQMLSAEEAAQILGLQVRTVRGYLRDGRLPGVRIGKQYRIASSDLEAFTDGAGGSRAPAVGSRPFQGPASAAPTPGMSRTRATSVELSSVLQVDGADRVQADMIERTLLAATVGRAETAPPLRAEPLYDEQRGRLRIVIVGALDDAVELMRIVARLVNDP